MELLPKPAVTEKPAEPRTHLIVLMPPAGICVECGTALRGTLDIRARPMPQFIEAKCGYLPCPNHNVTVRFPLLFVRAQIVPPEAVSEPAPKLLVPV